MLTELLKRARWFQDLAIRIMASVHPQLVHTREKVDALRRVFHLVNFEGVPGDYVEFGVYEGASFIAALECHMRTMSDADTQREFWGFDSFEGLRFTESDGEHAQLQEKQFATSYHVVKERIKRAYNNRATWHLVRGYIEDTLSDQANEPIDLGPIAIAMFDMDLGKPTELALEYVRTRLARGSILMFDEFFMFRGSLSRGEAGAFQDFRERHPELRFRRYLDYGIGGRAYVLVED